ncbi:MAG: DEAD/DEAH box helicase family protein, partial [Bacillota bacterium]|nr:DEAD/DEAH box helicase family protein [Bacillota bacterium]
MTPDTIPTGKLNSLAEDLFMELFCDTFGPEKSASIYIQYPFTDIYGNSRFIDFAIESEDTKIAIEIDGETWHNPTKVSQNKYLDDLLKQNSMVHQKWRVFRWVYQQLQRQPEKVRDELRTFLGDTPLFREPDDYLPRQKGRIIDLQEHRIDLKQHQQEALDNLAAMRRQGETIALLYHATGAGKTVTAVSDAKKVGKRTLMLAHTRELVTQAHKTFQKLWPEVDTGLYLGSTRQPHAHVLCGSIQGVVQNLDDFSPDDFGYLIIDECHHAAADSYRKVLSHFNADFTLGLTATPERSDGINMLEDFQNVAHKLDLKTAVEMGELAPIRCIRIKTNVDLSSVRINGIKYNSQDLESKLFVPERNRLILETWQQYVRDKKTVIFCASVAHAGEIAALFREAGIRCEAVSGTTKKDTRDQILQEYEQGDLPVLCACDLLNEGWDSPRTEVLFMARPTLSKTLYLQQLGRGMRKYPGKESLVVFDFIDNANLFNMPYSAHRVFDINKYKPGEYVLESSGEYQTDRDLMARGEKPTAWLDFPISITDYQHIDLFNWQV